MQEVVELSLVRCCVERLIARSRSPLERLSIRFSSPGDFFPRGVGSSSTEKLDRQPPSPTGERAVCLRHQAAVSLTYRVPPSGDGLLHVNGTLETP